MNKFIIITPAYKVEKWVDLYATSLLHQTYKNFEVYFIDDNSPDNTVERLKTIVQEDPRFHIIKNEVNIGSPLANIIKGTEIANPDKEDIIVNIDGDDWLSSTFVLEYLNRVYTGQECWLTHGSYQIHPSGEIGGHSSIYLPTEYIDPTVYKKFPFCTSHLRTYKFWLYNSIDKGDLINPTTGEYYKQAGDLALMFPMLEMAGSAKIFKIEDILLILNRENELNEATVSSSEQKQVEHIIRNHQRVYERITTS